MARSDYPKTDIDLLNEWASSLAQAQKIVALDSVGSAVEASNESLSSSVARTASLNTADQTNRGHRGVYLFLRANAGANSSETLTINIQARIPGGGSSDYVNVLAGSSFHPSSSGGIRAALLYPDGNVTAAGGINDRASAPLPRIWRARIVQGTTKATDYSLRAVRLP